MRTTARPTLNVLLLRRTSECNTAFTLEVGRDQILVDTACSERPSCLAGFPAVSPVDGANLLAAGNGSQTMESFMRMLMCLPMSWLGSVTVATAAAATIAATRTRGAGASPRAWRGAQVVSLKHFGPSGGKAMTLRALRGQQLGGGGVTVVDSDDVDFRRVAWARMKARAAAAAGGSGGARLCAAVDGGNWARPSTLSPAAAAADDAGDLASHVISAVLSAVRAVGPGRHCSPRHPTQFEPSSIELSDIESSHDVAHNICQALQSGSA